MVQIDPQAAVALIGQLDVEQVAGALPELAAIDPAAALEIFNQMGASERSAFPVDEFLEVLAGVDF